MVKMTYLLISVFFFISCNSSPIENNKNEDSVRNLEKDTTITSEKITKMLLTTSSSMEPSEDINLYDCNFTIVISDLKDTTHWSTNDNNFKTPEGFKIGINWNEIPLDLQNSINRMSGWGYYIILPSGWQLGFCEGQSCTDTDPKDGLIVKWIFKRND